MKKNLEIFHHMLLSIFKLIVTWFNRDKIVYDKFIS